MISYDFEYYRPDTYEGAVKLFHQLNNESKNPLYYSGGTEIVTNARKNVIKTGAIIDIKAIPEGNLLRETEDAILLGANLTLNEIIEGSNFPLLNNVIRKIADHTVRNRLTLGGNICGRLAYREAILPLLTTEAKMVVAGENGLKSMSVGEIFDKRLKLQKGEILLQVEIPKKDTELPYYHERKEKQGEIDYPLVHVVALKKEERIKAAFTGICAFPFRSPEIEEILNDKNLSFEERAKKVVDKLPSNSRDDVFASKDFREFLMERSIIHTLKNLEGGI
ncbi:MAG: FAD binding domain-containing protein [Clostridiaceae bacterium]|nr:FAD binding domain-containing protein [Clostridiaceae bacterium]